MAWAEGSDELSIALGGFNTVVLITSSLTMALGGAIRSDRHTPRDREVAADYDSARIDVPRRQFFEYARKSGI